jgi:hypothetical protein
MASGFRYYSFVYDEQNVRIFDSWQSVSYDDGRPTLGSLRDNNKTPHNTQLQLTLVLHKLQTVELQEMTKPCNELKFMHSERNSSYRFAVNKFMFHIRSVSIIDGLYNFINIFQLHEDGLSYLV